MTIVLGDYSKLEDLHDSLDVNAMHRLIIDAVTSNPRQVAALLAVNYNISLKVHRDLPDNDRSGIRYETIASIVQRILDQSGGN